MRNTFPPCHKKRKANGIVSIHNDWYAVNNTVYNYYNMQDNYTITNLKVFSRVHLPDDTPTACLKTCFNLHRLRDYVKTWVGTNLCLEHHTAVVVKKSSYSCKVVKCTTKKIVYTVRV